MRVILVVIKHDEKWGSFMEEKISAKIREFRKKSGITLKELSELTQLSVSFLSQVERGVSSMTITSLKKIADALNVQMKDLIDVDESMSFVNHKSNQLILNLEKSYISYTRLSGKFENRKLEGVLLTMEPRCFDQELSVHEGEEFYYIMSGAATFLVNGVEYEVSEGGVIHFPSTLPHKTINKETCELKMLCVVTPTIF